MRLISVLSRRYNEELRAELAAAPLAQSAEAAGSAVGDVRLQYDSQPAYERHAAYFGMLQEWRDGVPRGGYNGTVRRQLVVLGTWSRVLCVLSGP